MTVLRRFIFLSLVLNLIMCTIGVLGSSIRVNDGIMDLDKAINLKTKDYQHMVNNYFIENGGQMDTSEARFYNADKSVLFKSNGLMIVSAKDNCEKPSEPFLKEHSS